MNRRGQTLAALMIAIAIIAILAAVIYIGPSVLGGKKPTPRADGLGNSNISRPGFEAKDEVCRNNLRQVRTAVQMARMTDEPPSMLEEIASVSSISRCPIGSEPYSYDPGTGEVACPHPGHEKF